MKQLSEMQLLAGQRDQISMSEFRKNPGQVIEQVQMGKTFTITKAGKIVAVLSQPEPNALELGAAARRVK